VLKAAEVRPVRFHDYYAPSEREAERAEQAFSPAAPDVIDTVLVSRGHVSVPLGAARPRGAARLRGQSSS
jgi:hypothetical protein